MSDNRLELVVEIDTNRANASIKSVNSSLSSMEAAAAKSARGASAGIDGLTASMVKGAAAGTVLGHAFEQAVGWLKEYGAEIVKYAARTQTLGMVTNQLAKVGGTWAGGDEVFLNFSGTLLGKSVFPADTPEKIAAHFAYFINETLVGVWAEADGGQLTITVRSPAPAYSYALSETHSSAAGTVNMTGSLTGGVMGERSQ